MCDDYVVCSTKHDLENAYDTQCQVSGVYRIRPFKTKKNTIFVRWPVLVLDDGTIVLLESFWKHKDGRSPAERKDLIGKLVEARGLLHREPPAQEGAQNIAIPCIAPVEQIELASVQPARKRRPPRGARVADDSPGDQRGLEGAESLRST